MKASLNQKVPFKNLFFKRSLFWKKEKKSPHFNKRRYYLQFQLI